MNYNEIGELAEFLRHPCMEDIGVLKDKCRQAAELLETAKYSFYVEPNRYEVKHLRDADEVVRVNDLLDRFIDIDETYHHTPWNLLQIINNIAMVAEVDE